MQLSLIVRAVTILVSSLWIGCGADEGLGECPTGSTVAEAAGHDVVTAKCVYCHSSQSAGSTRQGAPEDLNFDKLDIVQAEASEMYSEAMAGSMPPDPATKVTATDLENMRIWLACGAKDTAVP